MAVRQICLYLVAAKVDCVCECRFMDSHSQAFTVISCGSRQYCSHIFYTVKKYCPLQEQSSKYDISSSLLYESICWY